MLLKVVDHPVAAWHLTHMRRADTPRDEFRRGLDALTALLVVHALADAGSVRVTVDTPLAPAEGIDLEPIPAIVPVLRAGLGMLDAALRLLPMAPVGYVGMRRLEAGDGGGGGDGTDGTDGRVQHECYLESLPDEMGGRPILLLDPMLATGGSAAAALRVLAETGVGSITFVCALAAPEGVAALESLGTEIGLDLTVVTAAVDSHLDERAFIVPGLGDAGDRLYGTA